MRKPEIVYNVLPRKHKGFLGKITLNGQSMFDSVEAMSKDEKK